MSPDIPKIGCFYFHLPVTTQAGYWEYPPIHYRFRHTLPKKAFQISTPAPENYSCIINPGAYLQAARTDLHTVIFGTKVPDSSPYCLCSVYCVDVTGITEFKFSAMLATQWM